MSALSTAGLKSLIYRNFPGVPDGRTDGPTSDCAMATKGKGSL